MIARLGVLLAFGFLGCSTALAGDIYRFRTADGRTIFTDDPASVDSGTRLIETAKYDGAGRSLRAPELPDKARDRAIEDVRYAEAELLKAYNRLTAGVRAQEDELMPIAVMDETTPRARKGNRKIPRTPEYYARVDVLKADIDEAQRRLDQARERLATLN